VTDPTLLFLSTDIAALLLLGLFGALIPAGIAGFVTMGLGGLGALLCLPSLLAGAAAAALELPIGPPGLSFHLCLDPIAAFFLLTIFVCGTAVAAFAAVPSTGRTATAADPETSAIPLCLAGLGITLLAADAVTFAIGLTLAATGLARLGPSRCLPQLLAAFLFLLAVCLLTPSGFAPRFDAIRAAPLDASRATASTVLAIAGALCLFWRSAARGHWAHDALTAGAVIPIAVYGLLRLVVELPGAAVQAWWGFILLLIGGIVAVVSGWQAARHPDLDGATACVVQRQAGLAIIGLGLTVIAGTADLPEAASFGLAATLLLMLVSGIAGTLASLSAHALCQGADTWRLARLGGLIQSMPIAAAAFGASVLALSALPPSAGFAALWLLFHAILSAPRTGGLISQVALALLAAALALSAALATAAGVRLIGIAVLSRPRSVRGSAALDVTTNRRPILLALSGLAILIGTLPGLVLSCLADPAVRMLTGTGLGARMGWATMSATTASPGYSALPVLALLALAIGAVVMITRRVGPGARIAGAWNQGLPPSPNLPFGDPLTQSVGSGFLPGLSTIRWPAGTFHLEPLRDALRARLSSATIGLWAILLLFGALLLVLAVFDVDGTHG
jgi:hydrogenase-4 component B